MNITVLGTGRWASNIAGLLLKNGHNVLSWEKVFDEFPESEFFLTGKNNYIDLSQFKNNGVLSFTHDLDEAIASGDIVFVSILSQKVDELMTSISGVRDYQNKKYVIAMKGVEATTGRTLSEILMAHGVKKNNIAVLAGPGHVENIAKGMSTHMVVAGYDYDFATRVKTILSNDTFRLFPNVDVKGVELCAAAKNVYGGLAGMCVGSNNDTLRGSLMCASLTEMERYLEAMQCVPTTARGLALLGDYDATLYDKNSHNLNYGIEVIRQNTANPKMPFVSIEGRDAASGLIKRMTNYNNEVSDKMQIEAPLIETYQDVVTAKISPEKAVESIQNAIEKVYEHESINFRY